MHKDSELEIHIRFFGRWCFPFLDDREINPAFTVLKKGEEFSIIWKLINGKLTKKCLCKLEKDFIDCFRFTQFRGYHAHGWRGGRVRGC